MQNTYSADGFIDSGSRYSFDLDRGNRNGHYYTWSDNLQSYVVFSPTPRFPDVDVIDNGSNFTNTEFSKFFNKDCVKPVGNVPYHPASSDLLNNAVQVLKEGIKKMTNGDLVTEFVRVLLRYRVTPTEAQPTKLVSLTEGI